MPRKSDTISMTKTDDVKGPLRLKFTTPDGLMMEVAIKKGATTPDMIRAALVLNLTTYGVPYAKACAEVEKQLAGLS